MQVSRNNMASLIIILVIMAACSVAYDRGCSLVLINYQCWLKKCPEETSLQCRSSEHIYAWVSQVCCHSVPADSFRNTGRVHNTEDHAQCVDCERHNCMWWLVWTAAWMKKNNVLQLVYLVSKNFSLTIAFYWLLVPKSIFAVLKLYLSHGIKMCTRIKYILNRYFSIVLQKFSFYDLLNFQMNFFQINFHMIFQLNCEAQF